MYALYPKLQRDCQFRDYLNFYEYFHADNGAGLGASHQTGWSGLVASLIELYGVLDPARALEVGKQAAFDPAVRGSGAEKPAAPVAAKAQR